MEEQITSRVAQATSVLKAAGATEVYLFGSAAGGSLRDSSDVDLAVAGLPPQRYFEQASRLAGILGRPIDLIDLDEDTPFTRYLRGSGELRRVG